MTHAPDGGGAARGPRAGPRSRIATTVTFFVNGFLVATWLPNIPAIKDRLDLDPAVLGLALAATAAGSLVFMPVAGWLVAHRGSAPVTTAGALLLCLVLPLPFLAPNAALLAVALFALGGANGSMDVAMNAQGVRVEALKATPIMSSLHAGWSLGSLAGALVTSLVHLAGVSPLEQVVIVAAAAAVVQLALGVHFERGDRAPEPPVLLAIPPRVVMGLGFLCFFSALAEGAVGDWSTIHLRDDLLAAAAIAPLGYAASSLAMALGRVVGDGVVRRFGATRTIVAGGLLVVGGMGTGLVVAQPLVAIVGFACVGFGIANVMPLVFSASGRIEDVPAGTALAATSTIGYTGFLIGPTVIGLTAQATSLPMALWIIVACGLVLVMAGPAVLGAAHGRIVALEGSR